VPKLVPVFLTVKPRFLWFSIQQEIPETKQRKGKIHRLFSATSVNRLLKGLVSWWFHWRLCCRFRLISGTVYL